MCHCHPLSIDIHKRSCINFRKLFGELFLTRNLYFLKNANLIFFVLYVKWNSPFTWVQLYQTGFWSFSFDYEYDEKYEIWKVLWNIKASSISIKLQDCGLVISFDAVRCSWYWFLLKKWKNGIKIILFIYFCIF